MLIGTEVFTRPLRFVLLLASASGFGSAATITILPGSGLSSNGAALAAFNRAANAWGSIFSDPVTVTVNANLANLSNPSVIGSASSVLLGANYTTVRNAMAADASDEVDDAVVQSLPTVAQFSTSINSGFTLNGDLVLTKANAKALGFSGLDGAFGVSDGEITFNSQFAFDYDNSNGVTPGTMDFETVAAHEIGHTLGFFSIVDTIDFMIANGQSGQVELSTLDLFRFNKDAIVTPANFSTATRSVVVGQQAMFSDGQRQYRFSTGSFNGDSRQASHWKDDALLLPSIGIMDPTLSYGQVSSISIADIRALDVIGWDAAVPEPGSMALLTAGLAALLWMRRRGSAVQPAAATKVHAD